MTSLARFSAVGALALILSAPAAPARAQAQEAPPASSAEGGPPAPKAPEANAAIAPPAVVAPTDDAADASKMAELLGDPNAGSPSEQSLRFYGFADFNAKKWVNATERWKNTVSQPLSFYVGKLNVYMDGNIAPDWKSLIEVRYMFIPNAAGLPNPYIDPIGSTGRYNATAYDYSDESRTIAWNGINIQRAYIEHNFNNYLTIRAGRFLTPWGIWNVDHGSPVIIATAKPYVIGEAFFPEAQTGFDAFGNVSLGDITLGYHLTLSNGRGPAEAFQDLDNNKAIGGRLSLKMYYLGEIDVGVSGYGGTVTDERQQINLVKRAPEFFIYDHSRELSWAADLRWLWKGLHFQTEGAVQDRVWDNDARPVTGTGVQADMRRIGMYALLGYRLPWLNLMPYAIYSYYDTGSRAVFTGARTTTVLEGGLNVRIAPSVVFKIEYVHATFGDVAAGSFFEDPLAEVVSQLAWAF
jgi:hypothetical protein